MRRLDRVGVGFMGYFQGRSHKEQHKVSYGWTKRATAIGLIWALVDMLGLAL